MGKTTLPARNAQADAPTTQFSNAHSLASERFRTALTQNSYVELMFRTDN